MDVVTHARAVRGVVVVAEHADALQLAHGNLRDVGQQVVRNALWILADQAALMRADGVEVTQQHDVPLVVAHVQVGEHLLEHALGPSVGVGAVVLGALLGDRDELGLAVHRCAAGEHDVLHAMVARHIAQHQRAGDVVPVVLQRLLHAFANRLEAGEVDDGVNVVFGEDGVKRFSVQDVLLVETQLGVVGVDAADLADAVDGDLAGIAQVVHDDHAVASLDQFDAGMAADESGTARDQDAQVLLVFRQSFVCHESSLSFEQVFPVRASAFSCASW